MYRDEIHGSHRALVAVLKSLQDATAPKSSHDPIAADERLSFLKAAHLYPTSKYPVRQEITLNNLLRKKLDPEIVTWVNEGRSAGGALETEEDGVDYEKLWDWAAPTANEIIRDVFVRSEQDEEDDEDEDDEDEMDTSEDKTKTIEGTPLELKDLLRLTHSAKGRR
jgi:hypothetical protein